MVEFNRIAELITLSTDGMRWNAKKPTEHSLATIQRELGLEIPDVYRRIAEACPNYVSLLSGIGDDFESDIHILKLNRVFHDKSLDPPLPAYFVLVSYGEDGDYDCWDLRVMSSLGEHPIVHVNLDAATEETPATVRVYDVHYDTFRDYLVAIALYRGNFIAQVPGTDPALASRLKELIREVSGQMTKK